MDKLITIDGPGGSGKGTVAKLLAAKLGWNILDSGALYRLIALISENIKETDPDSIGIELKDKNIFLSLKEINIILFLMVRILLTPLEEKR